MKPDKRRSPAPAYQSKEPGHNVLKSDYFTSLGDTAEGALRGFPALYVSHKYRLPLAVARVVCELAAIGRRAG
jgi:hypothetical protein